MDDTIQISDLQRVKLEPGDVVVVKLKVRVTAGEMGRITEKFRPFFPDNKVLIVSEDDVEMSIIEQGVKDGETGTSSD